MMAILTASLVILFCVLGCGTNFTGQYRFTSTQLEEQNYHGYQPPIVAQVIDNPKLEPPVIEVEHGDECEVGVIEDYIEPLNPGHQKPRENLSPPSIPEPETRYNLEVYGEGAYCPLPSPPLIVRTTGQRVAEILSGLLRLSTEFIRSNPIIRVVIILLARGLDDFFPGLCDDILDWFNADSPSHHHPFSKPGLERVRKTLDNILTHSISYSTIYPSVELEIDVESEGEEKLSHLKGFEIVY
ncbi:MAG: hypothetical protein DRP47_08150 [Candidatus Zixiibacteriota bacterium]|nr:MAG: hypothetical protein DRP47_08150 [candidate division Zixibacteria bacterium]